MSSERNAGIKELTIYIGAEASPIYYNYSVTNLVSPYQVLYLKA